MKLLLGLMLAGTTFIISSPDASATTCTVRMKDGSRRITKIAGNRGIRLCKKRGGVAKK